METVRNKKVLDAGCGEGYLSRMLARSEATVTAVDYSSRMIEIAKGRTPNDYEKAFQEMYRLLVDGGCFIFSVLHPCFVTPESGWEKQRAVKSCIGT